MAPNERGREREWVKQNEDDDEDAEEDEKELFILSKQGKIICY